MTTITSIKELEKIVRKYLISQSELKGKFVRNALSTYGETLDKLLYKQTFDTITPCDELMLFELKTHKSSSTKSMTEVNGDITSYKSYTIHVIIYGENAADVASKTIARLRTEIIRDSLLNEGVYIEEVTDDDSINEYINNVMWRRHDFDVNISCDITVTQVTADQELAVLDELNIKLVKETNSNE